MADAANTVIQVAPPGYYEFWGVEHEWVLQWKHEASGWTSGALGIQNLETSDYIKATMIKIEVPLPSGYEYWGGNNAWVLLWKHEATGYTSAAIESPNLKASVNISELGSSDAGLEPKITTMTALHELNWCDYDSTESRGLYDVPKPWTHCQCAVTHKRSPCLHGVCGYERWLCTRNGKNETEEMEAYTTHLYSWFLYGYNWDAYFALTGMTDQGLLTVTSKRSNRHRHGWFELKCTRCNEGVSGTYGTQHPKLTAESRQRLFAFLKVDHDSLIPTSVNSRTTAGENL